MSADLSFHQCGRVCLARNQVVQVYEAFWCSIHNFHSVQTVRVAWKRTHCSLAYFLQAIPIVCQHHFVRCFCTEAVVLSASWYWSGRFLYIAFPLAMNFDSNCLPTSVRMREEKKTAEQKLKRMYKAQGAGLVYSSLPSSVIAKRGKDIITGSLGRCLESAQLLVSCKCTVWLIKFSSRPHWTSFSPRRLKYSSSCTGSIWSIFIQFCDGFHINFEGRETLRWLRWV